MAKKKSEGEEKQPRDAVIVSERIEQLPVLLTDTELLAKGLQLAQVESQASDHEAHADSVKKDLKAKETQLMAERARLASIVRNRSEIREVRCDVVMDYESADVLTVRQDTGEVAYRRPMTNDERQRQLVTDGKVLAMPKTPAPVDPEDAEEPDDDDEPEEDSEH